VDRWEAAKNQSRKKWTDRRHLRKKLKEVDRQELRNEANRNGEMGGS
jgi:hypothetical protein